MKRRQKGSEKGIALFMVISALAVLSVLVAELTYSTQVNLRMAYNNVDNIKAYYLAKAGLKISLLRLKAYLQVKKFVSDPANKQIKDVVGRDIMDKIWSFPFFYPIPVPKEASKTESDAITDFIKESKLSGAFQAAIVSESNRLNLNNLFVREAPPEKAQTDGSKKNAPVEFRPLLEETITTLLEKRKNDDREFADVYRTVQGKDVVDAIWAYIFPEAPASNLPGFKPMTPKQAPFYSLSELHLVSGLDDGLYRLLEPVLTVYSTPGINVNSATKEMFHGLMPELTDPDLDDLVRKRDDPEVGKPWENADEFWQAVAATSAGGNVEKIKERFKKANLKIITEEESFMIGVQATHGMSTRRLEARVIVDPSAEKKDAPGQPSTTAPTGPGAQPSFAQPAQEQSPSANKRKGVNLIYWRII